MTNWATNRLNELVRADVVLPPVIRILRLGALDSWGSGWIKKTWSPDPDLLNVDGSLFGGYIAALADTFRGLQAAAQTNPSVLNKRLKELHDGRLVAHNGQGYQLTAAGTQLLTLFLPLHV